MAILNTGMEGAGIVKSVNPYLVERRDMVELIARRGVRDAKVLEAMRNVPREAFVPDHLRKFAYADGPLPIGAGQTISQPYIVASMTEAMGLHGGENVLEIGTGSGYAAAVLAQIAGKVYTIERIAELAERARATLRRLGYNTVEVIEGDGTIGWADAAPYDAIVVTAEGPRIPPSLCAQLKPGGRLVMPLNEDGQFLVRMTAGDGGKLEKLYPVRFVPLIGTEGWSPADRSSRDPLHSDEPAGWDA